MTENIEIKSIKKIGIKKTYDFKVPIYNNFVLANKIITHNSGKSNFILLLALIQCRYSGIWRHRKTGKLIKVLPRLKPLNKKEWEQLTVSFDFKKNMSFLDEGDDVKMKFNSLDRYHPFIIDEGSKNLHKYQWNNKLQFLLVRMSDTERWQNKSVYVCFPNFKELNSAFRNDRIFMRVYLYDRNVKEQFASCIISLRDMNRYVSDPWHTDDNAKRYEELLRKIPIALRTPRDILFAEKKLKNYAANFDVPSLSKVSPRIWDIYMKYKTYYANKDADNVQDDEEEGVRLRKVKLSMRKLIEFIKTQNANLTNKDFQRICGMSGPAYLKFINDTDIKSTLSNSQFGRY